MAKKQNKRRGPKVQYPEGVTMVRIRKRDMDRLRDAAVVMRVERDLKRAPTNTQAISGLLDEFFELRRMARG